MKTIGFWDNSLSERGTTVALYDYAFYNQTYLNNRSIIFYQTTCHGNDSAVIDKFKTVFEVIGVDDFQKIEDILIKKDCDMLYIIKSGEFDNKICKRIKTVVHCVFNCRHSHGAVYASISPWVSGNNGRFPVVPHMINLPTHTNSMREMLNIPEDALVFGRHGGYRQFDIPFVHKIVYKVAKMRPNIYFIFVNTIPFCPILSNIIHLPKIIDLDKKVAFINTCDAMIWGRSDGETFGLSIGEFSSKNKPVICCHSGEPGHINLLGDKAIIYNQSSLENILTSFNKDAVKQKNWNAYDEYTPERVMDIFKRVFIDS